MLGKNEKRILKIILENHLTVDHKHLTIDDLAKKTTFTEDELYRIIQKLLVFQYVKMVSSMAHWTVNPFTITEKGIHSLQFNWRTLVRDIFIGIATLASLIALFSVGQN